MEFKKKEGKSGFVRVQGSAFEDGIMGGEVGSNG
jgi:hypothetical protein